MKRLLVNLDEEMYEDLRRLAFEKNVAMAKLVRFAIDKTFEDELDRIAGMRGLEEYLKDPSRAASLDELLEENGIVLSSRRPTKSQARVRRGAG